MPDRSQEFIRFLKDLTDEQYALDFGLDFEDLGLIPFGSSRLLAQDFDFRQLITSMTIPGYWALMHATEQGFFLAQRGDLAGAIQLVRRVVDAHRPTRRALIRKKNRSSGGGSAGSPDPPRPRVGPSLPISRASCWTWRPSSRPGSKGTMRSLLAPEESGKAPPGWTLDMSGLFQDNMGSRNRNM